MKLTLSEIGKVIKNEDSYKGDTSFYGVVSSVVKDGNKTIGYNVAVGDSVIEARKLAGAEVGDVVLCTTLNNGATVVTGALNGDKDAAVAMTDAAVAKLDAATAALDAADALSQVSSKAPLTIIREYQSGVLVGKTGNSVGSLVNADGSFDVCNLTWSGQTPSAGTTLATFGQTVRVGKTSEQNIEIDSDSFDILCNGMSLMNITTAGTETKTVTYTGSCVSPNTCGFRLYGLIPNSSIKAYVNNTLVYTFNANTAYTYSYTSGSMVMRIAYDKSLNMIRFLPQTSWTSTASVKVEFQAYTPLIYTTIGTRENENPAYKGNNSFTCGQNCSATGDYSAAFGYGAAASEFGAFAAGNGSSAGDCSAAFGSSSAIGDYSFTMGQRNFTLYNNQTAIGKYNSNKSNTLFEIGNGTSESSRKNALEVESNGLLRVNGNTEFNGNSSISGNLDITGAYTISGSKLLKVTTTTKDNVSIAKATTGNGSFTVTSQSGYTPVGIVGFDLSNASSSGTGVGNVVPLQWQLSGSTVNWQIRNTHASNAAKIQIQVFILYAKTGLI